MCDRKNEEKLSQTKQQRSREKDETKKDDDAGTIQRKGQSLEHGERLQV